MQRTGAGVGAVRSVDEGSLGVLELGARSVTRQTTAEHDTAGERTSFSGDPVRRKRRVCSDSLGRRVHQDVVLVLAVEVGAAGGGVELEVRLLRGTSVCAPSDIERSSATLSPVSSGVAPRRALTVRSSSFVLVASTNFSGGVYCLRSQMPQAE